MIRSVTPVIYKKVQRISPSQFYAALQCPYKMILAEAYGFKPLIALSPNAYFGSILHHLIELIAKKVIVDLPTFEQFWRTAIQKKEDDLTKEGLLNMVPIKSQIKDVGLKKIQLQKLITAKSLYPSSGHTSSYKSEMPLFDDTGRIFGKADLVYEGSDYVEIYDFKTGNISKRELNEEGDTIYLIKEEYQYQLKLYAYLYLLRKGKFPDKLYLISLDKRKVEIPFNIQECESLYQQAIDILDQLDDQSVSGDFGKLANCSEVNCKSCMYRPACKYYRDWMGNRETITDDVSGVLISFKVFPNGNACAYITEGNNTRIISGFNQKDEATFIQSMNKKLTFYNIRKDKNSINLVATKSTTIYECS